MSVVEIPSCFWSTNWARNYNSILEWARAVSIFCSISPEDHKHFFARKAMLMTASAAQDVVLEYGVILGHLIEWIQSGICALKNDVRMPEECIIPDVELSAYRSAWTKHVAQERQSLSELKTLVDNLSVEMKKRKAVIDEEDTDGHSSYSDYSEEETESEFEEEEDEEEEDDDDVEEEHPRRRFKEDQTRRRPTRPPRREAGEVRADRPKRK